MKRRRLSDKEKYEIMKRQGFLCGCGCHGPVWPGCYIHWDHVLARGLFGSEDLGNFQGLIPACHDTKTRDDCARMDKAERQARRTGKQKPGRNKRRLKGRGFQEWRGFAGDRRGK